MIARLIVKTPFEGYDLHMIQKTYKLNSIGEISDIAIKIQEDPVCNTAGCSAVDEERIKLAVSVKDSGIGIII